MLVSVFGGLPGGVGLGLRKEFRIWASALRIWGQGFLGRAGM